MFIVDLESRTTTAAPVEAVSQAEDEAKTLEVTSEKTEVVEPKKEETRPKKPLKSIPVEVSTEVPEATSPASSRLNLLKNRPVLVVSERPKTSRAEVDVADRRHRLSSLLRKPANQAEEAKAETEEVAQDVSTSKDSKPSTTAAPVQVATEETKGEVQAEEIKGANLVQNRLRNRRPGAGDLTLQVVTASIEAGNFTYYTLTYNGFISLVLESLEGDADLYISQHTLQPSFNPETYCLHSASCGIDQIDIPSSFQRPIGVAVYGHPFHPISTYTLSVILKEDPEAFNFWAEEDLENYNKETPAEETEKTLNKRNHVQDEEDKKGNIKMLEYENQMFLDLLNDDGLLVTAKGIGLDRVFVELLKVYSDAGNLVIVIGTSSKEEDFFINELDSRGVKPLPRILSSEYSTTDRQLVYMEGGVIFASSRILVVDFLMGRVPADLITGILVYKAHKVTETSQEAFILRLYRQRNNTGFVKAFSSSPVSFTRGFSQVTRVMRSLFVRNLFLWPRFHATLQSSLSQKEPEVIELRLPLTGSMITMQTAILDLIQFSVKELKRCNPAIDLEEMSVENALSKSFHKIIKIQLEPVWHQLSSRTKQIISDLGTLRNLLLALTQYDCVTFHNLTSSLRTTEQAIRSSGWMILDAAETLFVQSKARVYGVNSQAPVVEENPKWTALVEVVKEIRTELASLSEDLKVPPPKALVVAKDDRTCHQLRQVLEKGSREFLLSLFDKSNASKDPETKNGQPKKGTKRKAEESEATTSFSVEQMDPLIILPISDSSDPFLLSRTLHSAKPTFIVVYDCDVSLVRQIEVYQAVNKDVNVRVYFLIYDASAEEQAYLTMLRKEKEAFELLIREKATMVIPEDQDGKSGNHPDLVRDSRKASEMAISVKDTRNLAVNEEAQMVIVDMREFRSDLPSLLHKRGIDIIPVTLEIGDYILTPEICVERKSLSDLIGSLNSGRLYNQAQAMCRHYAKPMLLIEFEHDKPFALQGKFYLSSDASSSTDVTSRLQLLTLHFPKLRILWSPGPYATAEVFQELKKGRVQPSVELATSFSVDSSGEINTDKYNPAIFVNFPSYINNHLKCS
nr:EOG090X03DI [Eulimnadia texana]